MSSAGRHEFRFAPGKKPFGEYVIDAALRWSGIYEQYEGHTKSGVPVGIKVVFPEGTPSVDSLAESARPCAVGMIALFDFDRLQSGDVVIVTESAAPTLRERIADNPLPSVLASGYLRDIVQAFFSMDVRQMSLPIISPESVVLREDGAKIDDHYLPMLYPDHRPPVVLESAPYMAPEMDQDPPNTAAAMFMLGVIYFEMLCGRPPFAGGPLSVIAAIRAQDADVSAAPSATQPLLRRLLARDPRQRPARFEDLLRTLDGFMGRASDLDGIAPPPDVEDALSSPAGVEASEDEAETGPRLVSLGRNKQGYPEFRRTNDGGVMVLLPGGTFRMGTSDGRPEEGPPVEVHLDPFLIDKAPVSWDAFMNHHVGHSQGCDFCALKNTLIPSRYMPTPRSARTVHDHTEIESRHESLNDAVSDAGGEKIPATYLTAGEMESYAEAHGCKLPGEAEWEYAYRGGTGTRFYWGDEPDPAMTWCQESSGGRPHAPGALPPNPFGLSDMAGNVAEVCRDNHVKEILRMVAEGDASVEELAGGVERPSPRRSVRGGSYNSSPSGVSATFRTGTSPDLRSESRGFRMVIRSAHAPEWARAVFEEGSVDAREDQPSEGTDE